MKLKLLIVLACVLGVTTSHAQNQRPSFNKAKDLILIQHDNAGDPDDINCLAVEGSMLRHPDFKKSNNDPIDIFFVAGTRGYQQFNGQPSAYHKEAEKLYKKILGRSGRNPNKKWITTGGTIDARKWNSAVRQIKNRVAAIINNGGRVWVMEAGQSNFTADWLRKLIRENNGINKSTTQDKVWVVQHSTTNENNTANPANPGQNDLGYVMNNTNYNKIGGGFETLNKSGTPKYDSKTQSAKDLRVLAQSNANNDAVTRSYFQTMEEVLAADSIPKGNPSLKPGGVDFTDCVELWWILELGNKASSISKVYNRYVID